MLKNQKGITLIALIITIIVMLILVGVTINVALNGGLFSKAEEATTKTKIAQIQEALAIKKAEILADYEGVTQEYNLTIDDLSVPTELKNEFSNKLIIGKDGILYYNSAVVTNTEEQNRFEEMGIQEYVGINTGDSYTFTLGDIVTMEGVQYSDGWLTVAFENFWSDSVSEELKNSTMQRNLNDQQFTTYNITCSDPNYTNMFDVEDPSGPPNAYAIVLQEGNIMFGITDANGNSAANNTSYANLTFTISMAEETDVPQEPVEPEITGTAYGTEELAYIITSDNRLILYTGGTAYNGSDMGYSLYTQKLTNHEDYANYTLSEDISESTMFIFNSDGVVNAVSPDKTVIYGLEIGTSLIQTAGSPLTLNESLDVQSIINSVF